jgi:hypothetical protein
MYTLTIDGVTLDGLNIPNDPRNSDWREYQAWLGLGNTPNALVPRIKPTIDQEYASQNEWLRALVLSSGADLVALKAQVVSNRP